eukprot:TRINITY_DN368_c0_g2_i3.p1 TRINITY_DN368_c0_g2~~TRINITY_DN368_c0_g2_i3.p1  ORF type:complete len:1292 (+),score=355.09 TRINITY_DN368_c0_g2_i3:75-3950(+)
MADSKADQKSKEKELARITKKKTKFLDSAANIPARLKAITSYFDLETDENCAVMFNDNKSAIFLAISDAVAFIETTNLKKGKHVAEKDIKSLLLLVKKAIIHIPKEVREPRSCHTVASVIDKTLFVETSPPIRVLAFELLLMLTEVFSSVEDIYVKKIISSLNLQSYQAEYKDTVLPPAHAAPDKQHVLFPTSTPSGKKETQDFLEAYFTFIERSQTSFSFWFTATRQLIALFYPEICAAISIPNINPEQGFKKGTCPPEIQSINICHVSKWLTQEQFSLLLLADAKHYQLIIEIYKTSLRMPIAFARIITQFISTLTMFIFFPQKPLPSLLPGDVLNYQRIILEELIFLFGAGMNKSTQDHVIQDNVIKMFFTLIDCYSNLDPVTRKVLLYAIAKCCTSLMASNPPLPTSAAVDSIKGPLVDTLLTAWLSSKCTDAAMWQDLQKCIEGCMQNHAEAVHQVKLKLGHLTLMIMEQCYPPVVKHKAGEKPVKQDTPGGAPNGDVAQEIKQKKAKIVESLDTKEPPTIKFNKDPHLEKMSATIEVISWMWHALLFSFRNISTFKTPKIYEISMNTLVDIMDLLLFAEEMGELERPQQATVTQQTKPRILLFNIFCPYLFEAVKNDESRATGTAIALGGLCKLFCRPYPKLTLTLLSYFYSAIRKALLINEKAVVVAILTHSYNIFSLALPGSSILIPYYLPRAKEMLLNQTYPITTKARQRFISMISSLICYPSHFPNMSLISGPTEPPLTAVALRDLVQSALLTVLSNTRVADLRIMCMWSITVCIVENCYHFRAENTEEPVNTLLSLVSNEDQMISRVAMSCLSTLVSVSNKLPPETVMKIADSLCSVVLQAKVQESCMTYVFFCLYDWVINDVINSPILEKIFQAIEFAQSLSGEKIESPEVHSLVTAASMPAPAPETEKNKKGLLTRPKKLVHFVRSKGSELAPTEVAPAAGTEGDSNSPVDSHKVTLKEAAECVLNHIMHFFHNFPSPEGVDLWSSQVIERDDNGDEEHATFWVFNNTVIISVIPLPKLPGRAATVRVIVRDTVGKWAWDFNNVNTFSETGLPDGVIQAIDFNPPDEPPPKDKEDSVKASDAPPAALSATNKLSEALSWLQNQHSELLQWVPSLTDPAMILSPLAPTMVDLEQYLQSLQAAETAVSQSQAPMKGLIPQAPKAVQPYSAVHYTRMLLQQLGFISPLSPIPPLLERISTSEKFKRNIAVLDKTPGREVYKLGLLHVKEGQEQQNDILANSSGSPLYTAFATGLAWRVDVATHRGYLGGAVRSAAGSTPGK